MGNSPLKGYPSHSGARAKSREGKKVSRTGGDSAASDARHSEAGLFRFRVMVPNYVAPGQAFQVYAGQRLVRVLCPPDARAGTTITLTIPVDHVSGIPLNLNSSSSDDPPVNAPKRYDIDVNEEGFLISVPTNVNEGESFDYHHNGQQLLIKCPSEMRAGSMLRIYPPSEAATNDGDNTNDSACNVLSETRTSVEPGPRAPSSPLPQSTPSMQLFEVIVPLGISGGQPFALLANQHRILVSCPFDAKEGQKIQFRLPILLTQPPREGGIESVRLSYDKDGWSRMIRVQDMKFQWMRFDQRGDISQQTRFSAKTSAYVRKLDQRPGPDERMKTGSLYLVPASEAVVDSAVREPHGRELVSYGDIASAQVKNFSEKTLWFHETCKKLRVEWDEGHMRINVRRDYLLIDSVMSIMSLSRKDLRKTWKFEFIGEEGIDAGGLAREWFQLVTEEIFNPRNGLWHQSAVNQMCMDINPASVLSHPADHLVYFRFLGRVLAKALFDQQLVSGHMIRHLYKHLLGWPVTFEDLEMVDDSLYNSLKHIMLDSEHVEDMCLNFTTTENLMGAMQEVSLVRDGENIDVTQDNLSEYIECRLKYAMLGRVKPQLTELLLGFFDVMEEPLLTVFDFQELELLMCGLPEINVSDWQENTEYTGDFANLGGRHQVCKWFWEVVEEYDQEYRARLLQFVTGTSGVPSLGFAYLQGSDGHNRNFSIHGLTRESTHFPCAHTCFNRIDLTVYPSKSILKEKLTIALEMAATGFDVE